MSESYPFEVTLEGEVVTVTPGPVALVLTFFAPTVTVTTEEPVMAHYLFVINNGGQSNTPGFPVTLEAPVVITPGTLALTLTFFAPTVTASNHQTVIPGPLALTLTFFAPTVTVSDNVVVTPGPLALTLTFFAPTVNETENVVVTPGLLALVLTFFEPTVTASDHQVVTPGTLALALTFFAPTVTVTTTTFVRPGTLALVLTFFAPTVQLTERDRTIANRGAIMPKPPSYGSKGPHFRPRG